MGADQVVAASLTSSATFAPGKVILRGIVHRNGSEGTDLGIVKP